MKIIRIEMSNYKKVRALDIRLEGKSLVVAGSPDTGKTTAVSALWDVISPIGEPLTHGEKKGRVRVTLGEPGKEYRVFIERRFTPKTNTLAILSSEGKKLDKGTVVDLIDKISHDPLKLLDMKGKALTEYLLSCAKLPDGVSMAELDERRKEAEQKRLDLRRDMDLLSKRLPEQPEEAVAVDTEALEAQVAKERARADEVLRLKDRIVVGSTTRDQLCADLLGAKDELARLTQRIATMDERKVELEKVLGEESKSVAEYDGAEYAGLIARRSAAAETNKKAEAWKRWSEQKREVDSVVASFQTADSNVKSIDAEKKAALDSAKWPIDGLSIVDGQVYYGGFLFENCGTEKQMRASASLVAANINGIKAIRVDRAESMGMDARKSLLEICDELGVQVCLSRVTDDAVADGEIQIVDGVFSEAEAKAKADSAQVCPECSGAMASGMCQECLYTSPR